MRSTSHQPVSTKRVQRPRRWRAIGRGSPALTPIHSFPRPSQAFTFAYLNLRIDLMSEPSMPSSDSSQAVDSPLSKSRRLLIVGAVIVALVAVGAVVKTSGGVGGSRSGTIASSFGENSRLAAGAEHVCTIRADSTVWCWGTTLSASWAEMPVVESLRCRSPLVMFPMPDHWPLAMITRAHFSMTGMLSAGVITPMGKRTLHRP